MKFELIDNVKFEGIDWADYPDLSDMYIESADYDGRPMDEDDIELLNRDSQMIYELYNKYND